MSDGILVINAGSSSSKFSVYVTDKGGSPRLTCKGQIEGIGVSPTFVAKSPTGEVIGEHTWRSDVDRMNLLSYLLGWIELHLDDAELKVAGHRVVHGGRRYSAPVLVNEAILGELEQFIPLAPLHQPHNLAPIRSLAKLHPGLPQVACFDTAFHRNNDTLATTYALPRWLIDEGVQRYGFHGLSYEYIVHRLRQIAPDVAEGRIVVCHLGSGASMCAIQNGRSVANTMGFTALDGLPMGTRPGQLDAGVVLYLLQEKKMDAQQIETLLYKQSGLLGLSGVSNDLRPLLDSDDPHAKEAVDFFVYRIGRELGSLAAAMGGLDAVVFTAGIGEHSPEIRARVMEAGRWLGMKIDDGANRTGKGRISAPDATCPAWVVPTDEELMIAMHTRLLLETLAPAE